METELLPLEQRSNFAQNIAMYFGMQLVVQLLEETSCEEEALYAENALLQLMNIIREGEKYEN